MPLLICDPKSRSSSLSSLSLKAEVKPEFEPEECKEIGHSLTERRRLKTEALVTQGAYVTDIDKSIVHKRVLISYIKGSTILKGYLSDFRFR